MNLGSSSAALALVLAAVTAAAAPPAHLNFVACPIVRDTKAVPCWITRYRGETYYLGIQQDIGASFYPPQLKHRILVEGVPDPKQRICGGIALRPVTVSPLPEIDRRCDTILPAGPYSINFAPRGEGPNRGGTPATDPTRDGRLRQAAPAVERSEAPKTFTVRFDFDNDYMTLRNTAQVSAAAAYAALNHARSVEVKGYRATTLLSNGRPFVEKPGIARARAQKVAQALREIGLASDKIKVAWDPAPQPGNGVADFENRKVQILVSP